MDVALSRRALRPRYPQRRHRAAGAAQNAAQYTQIGHEYQPRTRGYASSGLPTDTRQRRPGTRQGLAERSLRWLEAAR
ncbi:hypothetical protein BOS5A_230476 [Bosea sp. EC-HK365B]|nr:hypothetical protein BOSE21B_90552 [Bosea sp. 21B]CAD5296947.1 hypothetical protein BOSE7B_60113 [Bosea sp. 7B]CAD5297159.1 hypothetical protein BOSE46_80635 [Bosea sp. 46]VVT61199.1 hypothetical protein BOS5A_230476 [Bosea sp. EC-HK365B]VXB19018.1 hypothetical protein BOSE125_130159 [Bosea sp. 125]VXB24786.1 hypothetical protein BOSE127_110113 [Bosea sp. 127]